jgi:hypothetical protein
MHKFALLPMIVVWSALAPALPSAETRVATLPARTDLFSPVAPAVKGNGLGLYAHVSARAMNDILQREVKRRENVAESILSLSTRGTADVQCQVTLETVPNEKAATVRFRMTGQANMPNTVGTTRGIKVYSSSNTQMDGFKDIVFDGAGFLLHPAQVHCRPSVKVSRIDASRPLVERIAWRRVDRSQPQAEQIAGEKAALRAEQQLNDEVSKPLAQVHQGYVETVYPRLKENEATAKMAVSSTAEHIVIKMLSPIAEESSEFAPPPAYDLAVLAKDSFVNDVGALLLGNKTVADTQLANWMQTLTGKTPPALWVHDRAEPWSLVMAARPLDVMFRDEQVRITMHMTGATRGAQRLDQPMHMSVTYTLEITRDGPRLVRVGDLRLDFDDLAVSAGEPSDGFRQFLTRKFNGLFPADLYFDGLTPPAGGTWAKLHCLSLSQFTARDGWFAIGYTWNPETNMATRIVR